MKSKISRLCPMVIAALWLLAVPVETVASDFVAGGIHYEIDVASASAVVTTSGENAYAGSIVIPGSVTSGGVTYRVTAVGDNAFAGCQELQAVTLGENIARVGKRAFAGCPKLTSMDITPAVTVIDSYAFADCSSLSTVTFDNDEPLEIGSGAFMRCQQLANVVWESFLRLEGKGGISSLGTSAMAHCTNLESIMLPGELEFLGTSIFNGCESLNSIAMTMESPVLVQGDPFAASSTGVTIHVPSSGNQGETASRYSSAVGWRDYNIAELPYSFVDINHYTYLKTATGTVALNGCLDSSNQHIVVRNSITDAHGKTLNVTSVAPQAFKGSSIKSLDTSHARKLKTLGQESFASSKLLTSVKLVEGITSMGDHAFASCSSLPSIELPSTLSAIPAGAFEGCYWLASVAIATGVRTIGEKAFSLCTSLVAIEVPLSLQQVERDAFKNCTALQAINVDERCPTYASCDGVLYERKHGEEFAPHEKKKMNKLVAYPMNRADEDLYIPCGVTIIEERALKGALHLKHVTIPATTTAFGENCFEGTSIETINYRSTSPSNDGTQGLTSSLKANATLQVPVGTAAMYQSLSAWSGFKSIVERDNVYQDLEFAYDWNSSDQASIVNVFNTALGSSGAIALPGSVTMSGYTFHVTELKNTSTQQVCQAVKAIIIASDSLKVIDTSNDINPIAACQGLESISVSKDNPYFMVDNGVLYNKQGNELYYYLHSNTQPIFTIPGNVETIMPKAFAGNRHLNRVAMGNKVSKLMGGAFEECTSLLHVNNARSLTFIGPRAFAQCTALKTFNGGEYLTTLGDEAFMGCYSLTGFPSAHGMLQSIGHRAFMGCSSLETVVFGLHFNSMGDEAFKRCTSLSRVFFMANVEHFGHKVFKYCNSLSQLWLNNDVPPQVDSEFFAQSGYGTAQLFVPQDKVENYSSAPVWNTAAAINPSAYLDNGADVNNDKVVNALDITLVMNVLLGDEGAGTVGHYDVNQDGLISATDITIIYEFILNGSAELMAYNFVNTDLSSIESSLGLNAAHPKIVAVNQLTDQIITTGFTGYSDNTAIAAITQGSTPQGAPCLEIVPAATGNFTLVGIVTDGSTHYYRAYPLTVVE